MFNHIDIRQVINNLQKKIFEHTDGAFGRTAVVTTIFCQQLLADKTEVDKVIYLTQEIGLRN